LLSVDEYLESTIQLGYTYEHNTLTKVKEILDDATFRFSGAIPDRRFPVR